MILFPAIDLKDGRCVRLLRGNMNQATIFAEDPLQQVEKFSEGGFEWLHIVDLNGAIQGRSVHQGLIKKMVNSTALKVQLGGGIRSMDTITTWIEAGVSRVVLGTSALHDPGLVRAACREYPESIAVGIDARNGKVAVKGWVEQSEAAAIDVARRLEDAGISVIIYTDIARDGAMAGVNIESTRAFAEGLSVPVIASGGISSMKDLQDVKALGANNVTGVIVGRALYEGSIDGREALALLSQTC